MDVQPLLRRIGLDALPPPDRDGLFALHRALTASVPYEALTIQLAESEPLDEAALTARVVGGRGGYCFELNTVLHALLREAGLTVERRIAHINDSELCNHMALVVTVGDEEFLADAGLGEGPLDPILLRDGHVHPGPIPWRVRREDGGWTLHRDAPGSVHDVVFADGRAELEDFQEHHRRLSQEPDSSFVRTLIVQRPYDDRVVTLRARTLAVDAPGVRERRVLEDEADLAAVLAGEFGITLAPGAIGTLWNRVVRQHDEFTTGGTA